MNMILAFCILLFTRKHFIIDVIFGVVFGHYVWMWAEKLSDHIDVKVFAIPFGIRFANLP
jgi:hypothetical protein